MRKIQIERKLFELLGHKFFVYENFTDNDLNIDDKSIYREDNQETLVDIFATNKFFSIWNDKRRHCATVICACYGKLNLIINVLKQIGISETGYSTYNCEIQGEDRVLYLQSTNAKLFIDKLKSSNLVPSKANVFQLKKKEFSSI